MDKSGIIERMEMHPVIAAVRHEKDLPEALSSDVKVIFFLHADIFNIGMMMDQAKKAGKTAFIHIDFLEGLGRDQKAIDYLIEVIHAEGIISTRSNHIKYAREKGLFAIQRFFLVDSLSYETLIKTVEASSPDMIEIMPGIMPSIIRRLTGRMNTQVIAGGLVDTKEEVIEALGAGAIGVSTAKKSLWLL